MCTHLLCKKEHTYAADLQCFSHQYPHLLRNRLMHARKTRAALTVSLLAMRALLTST
jgi:hypothetical protein